MAIDPVFLDPFRVFRAGLYSAAHGPALPLLMLLQALAGCGGEEAGAPVSRSRQLMLDVPAYRHYLSTLSATSLAQIRSSRKNMLDMALDLHSDSSIAVEAEAAGLDLRPEVAAQLRRTRRAILSNAMLRQAMLDATIPEKTELEELAHERYLRFRDHYAIPERRRVAHILLTRPQHCPCEVEAPEEVARGLRSRLDAGEDFAGLARAHSHDSASAQNGGELRAWVKRDGKMVPAFEEAVFALKAPGQVSAPVRSPYGIHLIQLLEIEKARMPPFEEVRERIEAQLINDIRSSAAEKLRARNYPDPDSIDFAALERLIAGMQEAAQANSSQSAGPAPPREDQPLNPAVQPPGDQPK
ncbi:MAG: peptidylprolyl isomerase [Methylococcales bacterium]